MNKKNTSIKGYFFYPVIFYMLWLLYLLKPLWGIAVFFLVIGFRIGFSKNKRLITICLVFFLLANGYFFATKPLRTDTLNSETKQTWTLLPDTIQVDGDFVKAKAKNHQRTYLLQYKLKTKEDKDYLLNVKNPLIVTSYQERVKTQTRRNLSGFDYTDYLKNKQVLGVYKLTEVEKVSEKTLTIKQPIEIVSSFRTRLFKKINQTFGPYTSFYMSSLILGINDGDNREVWNKLSLAHLFALSGLHVTFFITMIQSLLLRIGLTKEKVSIIEVVFLCVFIGLTGYSIGVVRATLQHIIKKANGRNHWKLSPLDCWSLTLISHSLFVPTLLFNIGGQLSYYLSFLILFIQPILKDKKASNQFILFQLLLTFFSIPLLSYYFYEFNVLSSVFSLLFTPILFQCLLPILCLALLFSMTLPTILINLLEQIISSIHLLAEWCEKVTFFQLTTGTFPIYILLAIITAQLYCLMYWESHPKFSKSRVLFLFVSPCLCFSFKYLNPMGMIAFVDVGQGDAMFIQLPFHRGNYVIDTGGSLSFPQEEWKQKRNAKRQADYTLIPFLKSKGVSKLDGVFITHAHEDHFGDIDRLAKEIDIKQLIMTLGTHEQENVRRKIEGTQIEKINKVTSATNIQFPGIDMKILFPDTMGDGQNNDSIVLKLSIHEKTFLLMGDLEKEGEQVLLTKYSESELAADCIKIGHHGSKTSSQLQFINAVNPEEAVISVGEANRFRHPSPETLDTLNQENIQIFRTDEQGMIYQKWLPLKKDMLKIRSVK
ncbi:DNA internalization-related competence protein ComEC/Rec2 [Vagococcus sp. AM17-17]|nr:DNA internalization-related competence protein ComEC/Rec2 [Vagococcus sp. AM17-17]